MFREDPELALIHYGKYAYLEPFKPDVEMNDGDRVTLGNTSIRVISTPGHSDGVMSFFFEVTDGKKSYTAAMHGGAGLNSMCRSFIKQYGNTHCREDFIKGLERVKNEHVDIVLGNHAGQNHTLEKRMKMLSNPELPNPFIDPNEWALFIGGLQGMLEQMITDEENGTDMI